MRQHSRSLNFINKTLMNYFISLKPPKIMQFLFRRMFFIYSKTWRVMKLILFLTLAGVFQASWKGFSQNINLNEKNVPLGTVFQKIKKQAGYVFFYDVSLIDDTRHVNVNAKNANIETVLK